jgi:glutathione S-transferase
MASGSIRITTLSKLNISPIHLRHQFNTKTTITLITSRNMSSLKPITIWGKAGPNPPKVRMLAKELGLPYELNDIDFADLKKPEYLKINPNGRMPAIHDPNEDLTLWESGAIIEYLVEKYDTERKVSFAPGSKEAYLAKQWLFFQGETRGPRTACSIH